MQYIGQILPQGQLLTIFINWTNLIQVIGVFFYLYGKRYRTLHKKTVKTLIRRCILQHLISVTMFDLSNEKDVMLTWIIEYKTCELIFVSYKISRPPDKSVYQNMIFFISHPKHMMWVLNEAVLLSTQNT